MRISTLLVLVVLGSPSAARAHGLPPVPAPASVATSALDATACIPRYEDDLVHETGDPRDGKIKVVEVVGADSDPDPALRDAMQDVVGRLIDHLGNESGGRKSLRFDLGTACGARSVDILTVRLAKPNAHYDENCTTRFLDEVRPHLKAAGARNAVLFVGGFTCGLPTGFAEMPKDDSPGPGNIANRGGYLAAVFNTEAHTALHEIGHTLGAVQASAPHYDQNAHCWDNDDVLCYPYTQAFPQSPLRPCVGGDPFPFDCGKDDYFSPAPEAGSYLATHWNTYDSVFMCDLPACVPERAPAPAPVAAPPAPAAAAPPASRPARARPSKRALRAARRRCRKVKGAKRRSACVRRVLKRPR